MLPSQYPVWQSSFSMHSMSLSRVLRQFACKICKGMSLHTCFNTVFSSPSVENWCFRSSCSIQAHMFSIQLKLGEFGGQAESTWIPCAFKNSRVA